MANYITIDGGTTNTRLTLVCDGSILDTVKYNVGVTAAIENRRALINAVKEGIQTLLEKQNKTEADIECILASGMITSQYGLCNLPHLSAPCGMEELAAGLHRVVLEEISPLPFVFVRGIKMDSTDWKIMDVMRGEETEMVGIAADMQEDCLYILPGSHSKLIYTKDGKVDHFSTELTGELISAVANGTILKGNLDLSLQACDEDAMQDGYLFAKAHGLNAALFKVRILGSFFDTPPQKVFSFFMGVVLQPEIENILSSEVDKVVIGGKSQLKHPIEILLKKNSGKTVLLVPDEVTEHATALGAVKIYEYAKA